MNWLEKVPKDFSMNRINYNDHFDGEINKLKLENISPLNEITALSQFFLGAALLGPNYIYSSIPVADRYFLQLFKSDVCSHYEDNQILEGPKWVEVTLHKAKSTSIQRLLEMNSSNTVNPVVKDLFLREPYTPKNYGTVFYRVNKNAIPNVHEPAFDTAWEAISSCYKLNGGFNITPIGWSNYRELCNSLAVRYISHRCDELVLAVDKNQYVISLDILF